MVIIEVTFIKPLSEANKFFEEHMQFLNKYYEEGIFISYGRKVPRDEGGVILARVDKTRAAEIIREDLLSRRYC